MNSLMEKYRDKVSTIRSSFDRQSKRISDNQQWHEQAKTEAHRELREKVQQELQSLKDQLRADQESRIKELEPKLFAVADHPSLQIAYRDAIQRAEAVAENQDQLSNLMDQALDTGDKTLAKGVAYVAFQHSYFELSRKAYEGAYQTYFDRYLELQSALSDPLSKESVEISFMFSVI